MSPLLYNSVSLPLFKINYRVVFLAEFSSGLRRMRSYDERALFCYFVGAFLHVCLCACMLTPPYRDTMCPPSIELCEIKKKSFV